MDLIRLILLNEEGRTEVDLSKYTKEQIDFHKALLIEAEYLVGEIKYYEDSKIPSRVTIDRITWNGYEFLEKIRNNSIWEKIKKEIQEKGLSFTIDIIGKVFEKLMSNII